MRNEQETPIESDLVPLGLIAVETGESVDRIAHRFGEAVMLDDVGMRAVSASVAREFFAERAAWQARQVEDARRRTEEAAKRDTVLVGAPA
ncbi:MAG TPA: hypothetical protein VMP13_06260 [Acidimicrobiia bacterium]|nr:hypothetical protein [Acidimicrobiia bacterium]